MLLQKDQFYDPFKLLKNTDCPIETTCATVTSGFELCEISSELTVAKFDEATQTYTFRSFDIKSYPTGSYELKFTGTVRLDENIV